MKRYCIYLSLLISVTSCVLTPSGSDKNNQTSDLGATDAVVLGIMDAYTLKLDTTLLFNNFDTFINQQGLPDSLVIGKTRYNATTKEALLSLIENNSEAQKGYVVQLKYKGFATEYFDKDHLVPDYIDFRKIKQQVTFGGNVIFDTNFTLNEFARLFPQAMEFQTPNELSIYRMQNPNDKLATKSFMVERKTNTPMSEADMEDGGGPTVEFTFADDKLIYMFFANF